MSIRLIFGGSSRCPGGTCPTVYVNASGDYIIQGYKINVSESSLAAGGPKKDLVRVPAEFIEAYLKKKNP